MQIFLGVTPREYQSASRFGRSFAHVSYRIGGDSSLLRQDALMNVQGGLMAIGDRDAPAVRNPEALTAAVLRECGRRGFSGVLLDFEAEPRPDLADFASSLSRRTAVYLPECYARAAPEAVPLLCTAISGGSFNQYMQEKAREFHGKLALDVQRLRMDFTLPAATGEGTPLSADALRQLMQEEQPAVFFSQDLCARYFTFLRDGVTHFVLYDDADTLKRKLRIGSSLQLPAAFLMWPEIQDLSEELFRK